jgi:hypothetical protein
MRGIVTGDSGYRLWANQAKAESAYNNAIDVTSTGFSLMSTLSNTSGNEYIFMAIRRSKKPAKDFEPEELFAIDTMGSTGDGKAPDFRSDFPVDMAIRSITGPYSKEIASRLTQGRWLYTDKTNAELTMAQAVFDFNNGWQNFGNTSPTYISWMWRRQPGSMDVVAFNNAGGNSNTRYPHGLGVLPELALVKSRDASGNWSVFADVDGYAALNTAEEFVGLGNGNGITSQYLLNATETDMGGLDSFGAKGDFIAYLFASVPGVSKLGSYTGGGGNANIDCGFTNGARFVLIKRTDAAGDWWFTVDPSDPSMLAKLNETDAASDQGVSIYQWAKGFGVSQTSGTNLQVGGATYIYYAIA